MFESRLESQGLTRSTIVTRVRGVEALNRPYVFEIDFACEEPLTPAEEESLLDNPISLELDAGEESRVIAGYPASLISRGPATRKQSLYRVEIVPRMRSLALRQAVDVHLDVSIPELVKRKVLAAGLDADDIELRLADQYPSREFVVQYRESTLAFVDRLLEHWGISYFFVTREGRDVLVLSDRNTAFEPMTAVEAPNEIARVLFGPRRGPRGMSNTLAGTVLELESRRAPIPRQFVVRDYNYRTPNLDLFAAESAVGPGTGGQVVEYGTHFKTPEEGTFFAKLRLEEARGRAVTYSGKSDLLTMAAGSTFVFARDGQEEVQLVVAEVEHVVEHTSGGATYSNHFVAYDARNPVRPARKTPLPRIAGVLTGRIETPSKGEYAEIDDEGRYKVRFLFDASDTDEAQASRAIRMIQPHAGPGYGMHFPLRAGVEVALTFVDGDPDRPVIAGTVPNPLTQSPVTTKNATHNVLRTGGGNEIDFDDDGDSKRIKMRTPRLNTIFQLGAPNAPEDGAVLSTFGSASTVANTSINAVSSIQTAFAMGINLKSAGDIVSYASRPSTGEKALMALSLVDAAIGFCSTGIDIARQVLVTQDAVKQGAATVAADNLLESADDAAGAERAMDASIESLGPKTTLPDPCPDTATLLEGKTPLESASILSALIAQKRAALDEAYTELAEAQDAYNEANNKRRDGSLKIPTTFVTTRLALIEAWKKVIAAEEELDGNETAPEGSIEPSLHVAEKDDVDDKDSSTGTLLDRKSLFTASGASLTPDLTKMLDDELAKVASDASLDAAKRKAAQDARDQITKLTKKDGYYDERRKDRDEAAKAKRSADASAYWLTASDAAKAIGYTQTALSGARTVLGLISGVAGVVALFKKSAEGEKNYSVFETVGKSLDLLKTRSIPDPTSDYKKAKIAYQPPTAPTPPTPPTGPASVLNGKSSTANLVGSEEVLALWGERYLQAWAPSVTVAGNKIVLATGSDLVAEPSFLSTPVTTPPATPPPPVVLGTKPTAAVILNDKALELRGATEIVQTSKKSLARVATAADPTTATDALSEIEMTSDKPVITMQAVKSGTDKASIKLEADPKQVVTIDAGTEAKITVTADAGVMIKQGTATIYVKKQGGKERIVLDIGGKTSIDVDDDKIQARTGASKLLLGADKTEIKVGASSITLSATGIAMKGKISQG